MPDTRARELDLDARRDRRALRVRPRRAPARARSLDDLVGALRARSRRAGSSGASRSPRRPASSSPRAARYRLAAGAMPFAQPPMRAALQARSARTLMQALAFLDASTEARPRTGWTSHRTRRSSRRRATRPRCSRRCSRRTWSRRWAISRARLERPGARFLDVGVGVASLAIGMCRAWPALHVVGVDTFDVPLAMARQNVERAGLAERIELRELAVEELATRSRSSSRGCRASSSSGPSLAAAVARVRASLRPGGWLHLPDRRLAGGDERRAPSSRSSTSSGAGRPSPSRTPRRCSRMPGSRRFAYWWGYRRRRRSSSPSADRRLALVTDAHLRGARRQPSSFAGVRAPCDSRAEAPRLQLGRAEVLHSHVLHQSSRSDSLRRARSCTRVVHIVPRTTALRPAPRAPTPPAEEARSSPLASSPSGSRTCLRCRPRPRASSPSTSICSSPSRARGLTSPVARTALRPASRATRRLATRRC